MHYFPPSWQRFLNILLPVARIIGIALVAVIENESLNLHDRRQSRCRVHELSVLQVESCKNNDIWLECLQRSRIFAQLPQNPISHRCEVQDHRHRTVTSFFSFFYVKSPQQHHMTSVFWCGTKDVHFVIVLLRRSAETFDSKKARGEEGE